LRMSESEPDSFMFHDDLDDIFVFSEWLIPIIKEEIHNSRFWINHPQFISTILRIHIWSPQYWEEEVIIERDEWDKLTVFSDFIECFQIWGCDSS
jgi:hypothetical protein